MGSMVVVGVQADNAPALAAASDKPNSASSSNDSNETLRKGFPIKGAGTLQLSYPKSWSDSMREVRQSNRPVTMIKLSPGNEQDFAVMLEVAQVGEDKTRNLDVKAFLTQVGKMELPHAVEKSIDIQELNGPEVNGAYFTVTDKKFTAGMPQPGEYKYLTQGYAKLKGLVITFRVVSNRPEGAGKATALDMVRSARLLTDL